MPRFSITNDHRLTVTEDIQVNEGVFPGIFRLTRELELKPYGSIKSGALATAALYSDGVLALTFVEHFKALRQWDNILLLFPDCVDTEILEALQAVSETPAMNSGLLWKAAAYLAAMCVNFV